MQNDKNEEIIDMAPDNCDGNNVWSVTLFSDNVSRKYGPYAKGAVF